MKTIAFILAVSAFGAGVGGSLFAVDEGPVPRARGTVLLLKNERALEGDIEKSGDQYRVRKSAGEIAVAADQTLYLAADWDDALAFMRAHANLSDPDERLRLARWCRLNHQIEPARVEAKCALEMRPKHTETRQLVKLLALTPTDKLAKPPASATSLPAVPQYDLSFASVVSFRQRVQPILMNTCITCHAGSYGGKFHLYRLHEGGEQLATQRNLAAVMAQIHTEKPAASPLLFMAVSAHGNAKGSPLPNRQAPTFLTLCAWIDQTLADNPHLFEKSARAPAVPSPFATSVPASLPTSITRAPALRTSEGAPVASQLPALPPLPGVVAAQTAPLAPGAPPPPPILPAAKTAPAPSNVPTDEFDPVHFNRQAHPERN